MLTASSEFRQAVAANSLVLAKATLTYADGTVRQLTGDDVMSEGLSFTEATSSSGSFDIGGAVVGSLDVRLNNLDGRFDGADFTGATIEPYVGKELPSGTEWLKRGVYNVEQPETYGPVISLSCTDNLSRLQRWTLGDASLRWPVTAQQAAQAMCDKADVTLGTSTFANGSYRLERPGDEGISLLEAMSYLAQATGNYVRCDKSGRVRVEWYDRAAFNPVTFSDAKVSFGSTTRPFPAINRSSLGLGDADSRSTVSLSSLSSMTVGTDDVVVTGVSVTAQNEVVRDADGNESNGADGETAVEGTAGYVLAIGDNPFVPYGHAADVARQVAQQVVGLRFRTFDVSATGDPCAEAGDPAIVRDRYGKDYVSYITQVTYKPGAFSSFSCEADPPARNGAAGASAATRAYVAAHAEMRRERDARQRALDQLAKDLSESNGLYETTERQDDGSSIYYLHDKLSLSDSSTVVKLNADALGVSTDGGKTYPFGIDVSGNAILNRIYAIGLDADYVTTGMLSDRGHLSEVVTRHDGAYYYEGDDELDGYVLPSHSETVAIPAGAEAWLELTFQAMLESKDDPVPSIQAQLTRNGTSFWVTLPTMSVATRDGFDVTIHGRLALPSAIDGVTGIRADLGGRNAIVYALGSDVCYREMTDHSNYWDLANGRLVATRGSIGGMAIGDSEIYNDTLDLNSHGLSLDYMLNGTKRDAGNIGTNHDRDDEAAFGLDFDLEHSASYMTWAYRVNPADSIYTRKLTYAAQKFNGYGADTLNVECDLDMHGHSLRNTGGFDGTIEQPVVTSVSDGENGRINWTYGTLRLEFRAGLLVGATTVEG